MKTQTHLAIEAFRDVEKAKFLLERKEAVSNEMQVPAEDLPDYYLATEKIRHEFEAKREKAGL